MKFGVGTCYASLKEVGTSSYKLNIVADMIRGLPVSKASMQLFVNKKHCSKVLLTLLKSCVANAIHNHGMDENRLVIDRVLVGKAMVLRRFMARGRGRSTSIEKRFSNVTIVLRQLSSSVQNLSSSKKISNK